MRARIAVILLASACSTPAVVPMTAPSSQVAAAPPIASAAPIASAESAPPIDETPTYDLAADLEARKKEAIAELGEHAYVEVLEGVFVVATPSKATGIGAATLLRRATAAYFNERFPTKPKHALSVYLFASAEPYGRYCRTKWNEAPPSPFGFFRPDERRIVLDAGPGIGTLTHELIHPILEDDFPGAPTWLDEGVASLFEAPILPAEGEIHGAQKNWRQPALLAGLGSKEKSRAQMATLFGMSDATFRDDDESLHYATARSFIAWLDDRNDLWPFYRAYREGVATDPTGAIAFKKIVGMTPDEAESVWERWAKSR